jgi:arylsulfatase A-like enzyme
VDYQVAGHLDQLEKEGLADNTIVFFYGDHGRGLPRAKRWPYDSGTRVPLLVRWPGVIKPGTVVDDLVSFIDLAPTLLSICGIDIPAHLQGRAFLGP